MPFGLLTYENVGESYNEGDYVQSIAARQFLPKIDSYISRERLDHYQGAELSIILNGWFMHEPQHWPPAPSIDPLFVSFHINKPYLDQMLSDKGVAYLKAHQPIGCRDYHTAETLKQHGIDAYYTGCLTLTLGDSFKRNPASITDKVLLVDIAHAIPTFDQFKKSSMRGKISHILRGNVLRLKTKQNINDHFKMKCAKSSATQAVELKNSKSGNVESHADRFAMAQERLDAYRTAKLVITSRIHCALPCLAMGTPVIFIKVGQTSPSNVLRFKGILDFMNVVDLDGDMKKHGFQSTFLSLNDIDVDNPPDNPTRHVSFANDLRKTVKTWLDQKLKLSK